MHIFPHLVKIIHIFSPNDLKYTELQKKGRKFSISFYTYNIHPGSLLIGLQDFYSKYPRRFFDVPDVLKRVLSYPRLFQPFSKSKCNIWSLIIFLGFKFTTFYI